MPSDTTRAANDLRTFLRADTLPRLGIIEVGEGALLAFDLAVGATLNDLAYLDARVAAGGPADEGRRRRIEQDLERLHSMAFSDPSGTTSMGSAPR